MQPHQPGTLASARLPWLTLSSAARMLAAKVSVSSYSCPGHSVVTGWPVSATSTVVVLQGHMQQCRVAPGLHGSTMRSVC
jgi:hypothetical protein